MFPLSQTDPKVILESTAVRFLSYRPRFKAEVINRLGKKAVEIGLTDPITLINQIIASLEIAGFIDDEKNLANYIRNRLETKMKGPYWIKSALLHLGLPRNTIDMALAKNAPRELQTTIMRRLIEKKIKSTDIDLKTKAKLYRSLISRGFSASLVAEAFDDWSTLKV